MSKTVFISGATSGIGRATALQLGGEGHHIIACGRRADRLDELERLLPKTQLTKLTFDVRDRSSMQEAIQSLGNRQIDVLINNAGNAHGLASFQEGDLEDWDAMMDINVKGLYSLTKALLPNIARNGKAIILNIGSIAGREVYPNGNLYNASKFAVDALSTAMRMDLLKEGIRVAQIAPGLVETEFSKVRFKGDEERASSVYQGYEPLQAEDIAELISFMISRPPHVNIADVLILPRDQAASTLVNKESK